MAALGFAALLSLASSVGFAGEDARIAAAIALAESGGIPTIVGDNGTSYGLWQIHAPAHPEADKSRLLDPTYNATIAAGTYRAAHGFTPWTTYRTGAYKRFLPASPSPSPPSPKSLPAFARYAPALVAVAIFVSVAKGVRR